jgi:hypothetical protein
MDTMARISETMKAEQKFPLEKVTKDDVAGLESKIGAKLPASWAAFTTEFRSRALTSRL